MRPLHAALTAFAAAVAASAAAEPPLEPAPPLPEQSVHRGVAVVQCATDATQGTRAHGALLDFGSARPEQEVVLTVAHSLPPTPDAVLRDCVVIGDRGRPYPVTHVWLGDRSRASDWAVLATERRIRGNDVVRLRFDADAAAATLQRLTAERTEVTLLHGAGDARCEMRTTKWLTRPELTAAVYAHSCPSWPGLSGSPMVLDVDGAPLLIGVHMGELAMESESGEPEPLQSLGRGIDASLGAALAEAAGVLERR